MGGCRCTFRSCTVNTQNFPGMHFFRYPLKHPERLKKWVEYANNKSILDLPKNQAVNKVVCALHFRDDCFMNFKKDRLIPNAIPTLDRLRNGYVLDYSTSPRPKPIRLPPTTEEHLIPPVGYQPLGLPEHYNIHEYTGVQVLEEEIDETDCVSEPSPKRSRNQKILNKSSRPIRTTESTNGHYDETDEVTTICVTEEPYDGEDYGFVLADEIRNESLTEVIDDVGSSGQTVNLDEIELLTATKDEYVETEPVITKAVYDQALAEFEMETVRLKMEMTKRIKELEIKAERLEEALAQAREEQQEETRKTNETEFSVEALKRKLQALEAENFNLKTSVLEKPRTSASTSSQLTKAQLFNGIKKYLSASMTSLVRMEMFGAPERDWKPDEKQVTVEILKFGHGLYEYMIDEWRFRLPPKKLVEQWAEETQEDDEEDL